MEQKTALEELMTDHAAEQRARERKMDRAYHLLSNGRFSEADALFNEILAAEPFNKDALTGLKLISRQMQVNDCFDSATSRGRARKNRPLREKKPSVKTAPKVADECEDILSELDAPKAAIEEEPRQKRFIMPDMDDDDTPVDDIVFEPEEKAEPATEAEAAEAAPEAEHVIEPAPEEMPEPVPEKTPAPAPEFAPAPKAEPIDPLEARIQKIRAQANAQNAGAVQKKPEPRPVKKAAAKPVKSVEAKPVRKAAEPKSKAASSDEMKSPLRSNQVLLALVITFAIVCAAAAAVIGISQHNKKVDEQQYVPNSYFVSDETEEEAGEI